ncbi:MAG: tyrosine-protein phosphatase [Planctomycetota bacterium]
MAGEPFNPIRFARNAVLIASGCGLVAWIVVASAIPNLSPKRFHTVVEGELYRSGKLTPAAFKTVVREHDIKTIVDLGAWPDGSVEDTRAARTAEALGVDRVEFDLHGDATGELDEYAQALAIMIDPARQPVLIHCGAGTERTGCAVMLYRTLIEGADVESAYAEAESIGHSGDRNPKLRGVYDAARPVVEAALQQQ